MYWAAARLDVMGGMRRSYAVADCRASCRATRATRNRSVPGAFWVQVSAGKGSPRLWAAIRSLR
jgi:hypothetical protein